MNATTDKLAQWTIRDAVLQFCFEDRVHDVQKYEHYYLSQTLAEMGYPNLGGTSNRGRPTFATNDDAVRNEHGLAAAWRGILLDLCKRLEKEELAISGVQTHPAFEQHRTRIPGQWAMEFEIDPLRDIVEFGDRRFVNVIIEEFRPTEHSSAEFGRPPFDSSNFPSLDDDTVFTLLEEHCRRVVESPNARMISPGKISFGPILLRKLHHRAAQNEMRRVLAEEAAELEAWLKSKITGYQLPTAASIANLVRKDHRNLKP